MASTSATLATGIPQLVLKNILVTTDFSDTSRNALSQAVAIARLHGASITLLHVVAPEPLVTSTLEPAIWEHETEYFHSRNQMKAIDEDPLLAGLKHECVVLAGGFTEVLERTIQEHEVSMVVTGTHGRSGIRKLVMGSAAEEIFRIAPCPVMTIGPDVTPSLLTHGRFQSVLFATDFSEGSRHALAYALAFAHESHAKLTFMHVLDEGAVNVSSLHEHLVASARERLAEMMPEGTKARFNPDVEVVSGYPVEEILHTARKDQCDLIVMGVHKSRGLGVHASAHLPWTIAHSVVCHAPCPVLTVRG